MRKLILRKMFLFYVAVVLQSFWCFNHAISDDDLAPFCEHTNNQSHLNSFLWKVERNPPAYFFGTIHVPYPKVWNFIPTNTKHAFADTENIFFELDLTNHYTMTALASCQLLPNGATLENVLPESIYLRLKDHLDYVKTMMSSWITAEQRGRGLYPDYLFNAIAGNWERKRPVWVMLMVNSLTESDIKSRGIPVLDLFLSQEAERMNKRTGAVERVEEQCIPLNELNLSQVVFALNQTLVQHEYYRKGKGTIPYTTEDLIRHYNCGDLNSVIFNHDTSQVPKLTNSTMPEHDVRTAKTIDDYFRQELIYTRNQRMAQRVMRLLKAHPKKSFFFAFGAGHFLGNNTILDQLKSQGFQVTHVKPDHVLPRSKYKKKGRRKNILAVSGMSSDFPSSDIPSSRHPLDPFVDSKLYKKKHRKRNRRKKKKRKHGKKITLEGFNDLWVRLQTTSKETVLSTQTSILETEINKEEEEVEYIEDDYMSTDEVISIGAATSHRSHSWHLMLAIFYLWCFMLS